VSRVGKQPISVPKGVTVDIKRNEVTVKGPKGTLTQMFNPDITIALEEGALNVTRPTDMRHHRSLHGLTRALLNNMVTGVSNGFEIRLNITGVGYRAELIGKNLKMHLGYSHDVIIEPSPTISFDVPADTKGTVIYIRGVDKQEVGQVASEIRKLRPPEPYKGKGIAYQGEIIRRKAGKSGKGKGKGK
jgi:large subunit ribosomal protein L6